MTNVVIGNSVTSIGWYAFASCTNLTKLQFQANAPTLLGSSVFFGSDTVTVYYLPGTTGWGPTYGERPTALWVLPNPLILANSVGLEFEEFGFIISWATNASVVVETRANLANPAWSPVGTNTLATGIDPSTDGWSYFSDPDWMNNPVRFYRVRWP